MKFGTRRIKPPKSTENKRQVKSKIKSVTKRTKVPIRLVSGVKPK